MIQSIIGTAGKEDTELFVKEEEQLINLTEEAVLAAEKYQPFAEILGIQVSAMEEAIIVRVSRSYIRKIFANILENSLNYNVERPVGANELLEQRRTLRKR